MSLNDQTTKVHPRLIPSPDEAVLQYQQECGSLTIFSPFGSDPLLGHNDAIEYRESKFKEHFPDFKIIFHTLVNGNNSLFSQGLQYFIYLTTELSRNV